VHTLIALSSVLLVVLSGYVALAVLPRLRDWTRRRDLQFVILALPVASLALSIAALHHFVGRACFLGAPTWDYMLGVALPLGMGAIALGGLGLGIVRVAVMARLVDRWGIPAGPELEALAEDLARQLRAPRPRVLVGAFGRPLALTCGLVRPTLLLSTWMVERLDQRELEAVLAHELGHAARRDYLVVWLATLLRDAFLYLPTSWGAYRHLQREKEPACDDLAVGATRRPLALASALAKVWGQVAGGTGLGLPQALADEDDAIELRIERLLEDPGATPDRTGSRVMAIGVGTLALAGLLALEGLSLAVMLAPMGCGPVAPLARLLS
jgi:Zn-dependent protease with chaperone function